MKNYLEIEKEMSKNLNKIKDLEAQADVLLKQPDFERARRDDAPLSKFAEIRKSITEDDEQKAVELLTQAKELERLNLILKDNRDYSFCVYAAGVVGDILAQFKNKHLGEKTKEKMQALAHEKNIGFYFKDTSIYIHKMAGGYSSGPYGYWYISSVNKETGHYEELLVDNVIQDISNYELKAHGTYTEKPRQKLAQIKKVTKQYKLACEKALELQKQCNALLPSNKRYDDLKNSLSDLNNIF